jgi:hypothetical protein
MAPQNVCEGVVALGVKQPQMVDRMPSNATAPQKKH